MGLTIFAIETDSIEPPLSPKFFIATKAFSSYLLRFCLNILKILLRFSSLIHLSNRVRAYCYTPLRYAPLALWSLALYSTGCASPCHCLQRLNHIIRLGLIQKPDIRDLEMIPQKLPQMLGLLIASIKIVPHDFDLSLLCRSCRIDIAFLVVEFLGLQFRSPAGILESSDYFDRLFIAQKFRTPHSAFRIQHFSISLLVEPQLFLGNMDLCE